ncbi:hypothetical protein MCEMSEM29_01152 [Methylophilaceae bacterium]
MTRLKLGALKYPVFIMAAWITVLLLRLIPIGGKWGSLDDFTWFVFIIWFVVYFSAMLFGISYKPKHTINTNSFPVKWQNCWITQLSFYSIIGAMLIIYEFAITRHYGFSTPVSIIRILEIEAANAGFKGSWISGAGRMLTPALMVAWVLASLAWKEVAKRTLIILWTASAVVFYQQMLFEGGRFYLGALFVMIFLAKFFAIQPRLQKHVLIGKTLWVGFFLAVCLLFGYMFIDRYEQLNRAFYEAYETWTLNFDLEITDAVRSRLSGEMPGFWLAINMLWAYVTQGLNELNVILLSCQPDMGWGRINFTQIAQMLGKLTNLDFKYDSNYNMPKTGTYITLYGATYIDFGHVGGLIFISIVGWVTGMSTRLLHSRYFNGLSISAPLLLTLGIFSPIVSLVLNLWPAFCWALLVGWTLKLSYYRASSIATNVL